MSGLEPLLAKAFERVSAAEANVQISRVRDEQSLGAQTAVSYEVVVDASADLQSVAEKVLPRLVYFLDCRGLKLANAQGVFVSLFVGETLYFLHATDFVVAAAEVAGLDLEQLVKRYGAASV